MLCNAEHLAPVSDTLRGADGSVFPPRTLYRPPAGWRPDAHTSVARCACGAWALSPLPART
jgi:hypothetical protein